MNNNNNNNNNIVEELFVTNWILKQCLFITKDINKAEFYQSEIILKLLSLNNLVELYDKNEHKKYISKLIFNELTDKRKKKITRYSIEEETNNNIILLENEETKDTED